MQLTGPTYPFQELSHRVGIGFRKREIDGSKALKWHAEAHSRDPDEIPMPPEIADALRVNRHREKIRVTQRQPGGQIQRSLANNPMKHFLQKRKSPLPEAKLALKHEVGFIDSLVGQANPGIVLAKVARPLAERILNPDLSPHILRLSEYIDLLCRNHVTNGSDLTMLDEAGKQESSSHQGVSLGSFCERRLGLALARLMDYGYIRNFTLFGAAKDPVIANGTKNYNSSIDYNRGEEAMGIDAMVELEARQPYTYALLQAKAFSPMGFTASDEKGTFSQLELGTKELEELIKLRPEVAKFYKFNSITNKFYITVERDIFTVNMAERKIQKTCYTDTAPDIVNFLLASFEYMQDKHNQHYSELNLKRRAYERSKGRQVEPEKPSLLILDRPYETLTYPEKIAALIKSHFFKLVKEKPQTQRAPASSKLIIPAIYRKTEPHDCCV